MHAIAWESFWTQDVIFTSYSNIIFKAARTLNTALYDTLGPNLQLIQA